MSNKSITEEIITYGLDQVDAHETIEVNLKDILYIRSVLQEYIRFFHQPRHYQTLEDVKNFLGNYKEPAAFESLSTALYDKMYKIIPEHIKEKDSEGMFSSPEVPFYFIEKENK